MDSQSICLLLVIKGLLDQAIDDEGVIVLGPDAIACSTVAKYLRQQQFPSVPCDRPQELLNTVINNAILDALEKQ
jgi:hypothetical protein